MLAEKHKTYEENGRLRERSVVVKEEELFFWGGVGRLQGIYQLELCCVNVCVCVFVCERLKRGFFVLSVHFEVIFFGISWSSVDVNRNLRLVVISIIE